MVIDDVKIGQLVVCPMDGNDVGIVQSIDDHDGIVYVLFPVSGIPGRTDVIDVDPGDLEPAL